MPKLVNLIFFSLLLLSTVARASENSFTISKRVGKKLKDVNVVLTDLASDCEFSGKYFRIVKNNSNETVSFSDDPELVMKAATTYYYLTLSREYFQSIMPDADFLNKNILVRIEQTLPYSPVLHFDHSGQMKYNTALSIKAADDWRDQSVELWGNEIWFYKAKKIKGENLGHKVASVLVSRDYKNALLFQFMQQDILEIERDLSYSADGFIWQYHLIGLGMSFGVSELLPHVMYFLTGFNKQAYFLDSALIPEIICNEYAHIALAKTFSFDKQTPISEGFPNYFAYKITGQKKLAARAKSLSRGFAPRDGYSKMKFSLDMDNLKQAAFSSFIFSMLIQLEDALGPDTVPIYLKAMQKLDRSSNIQYDFENAIYDAIDEVGKNTAANKWKVESVFQSRGL